MLEALKNKEKSISVIGLGYVGLPLALAFAKKFRVIGYDINAERIELMKNKIDPSKELDPADFEHTDITFTSDPELLSEAHFHIIGVPTPVDEWKVPDLRAVVSATTDVSRQLKRGDYVVYESTVYPGCTEEECQPILEENSGLRVGVDFKIGFSPERINPGDKKHTLQKIKKVVSGCDEASCDVIAEVYGSIIEAGIHKAPNIKVAEAAKVIENAQRDINIAFMNELSIIFDKMDIETSDVLKAAGTKWNFLNFQPGLVGGHCIGVDPYYLAYKAEKLGYKPDIILGGRRINDGMPGYIANRLIRDLIKSGKNVSDSRVLVMGITFKEDVADIRNSKIVDLIKELKEFPLSLDVVDPYASATEVKEEYELDLLDKPGSNYDAIILAVAHDTYKRMSKDELMLLFGKDPIFYDLKHIHPIKQENLEYYSL
jgi:UDP-N-acetyl-D-galactosamine dehydrogenase